MRWRRAWPVLASMAACVAATGCGGPAAIGNGQQAATAVAAPSKEKLVADRAQARWQALIKGDVDAAYNFLSPGSKTVTPLAVYKTKIKPGLWKTARVGSVACDAEVCKAAVTITYDAGRLKDIQTELSEDWIIEGGNAWYVYR